MSSKLFQGVVHQMKETIGRTIGIVNGNLIIISCSDLSKIGDTVPPFLSDSSVTGATVANEGYTYKLFGDASSFEYAVFVEGIDAEAAKYASLLAISFSSVKQYYDEKYDRAGFVKNIVLDNVLPGDVMLKARALQFNTEVTRVVILVRILTSDEVSVYDVLQNLFPDKQKDFVFTLSESDVVLVKEIKSSIDMKDLEKLGRSIVDTLSTEFFTKSVVGIGTPAHSPRDLAKSFKEAQVALEVGKVFDTDKAIVSFDELGIARLVYQLPTTLCETFLREVFRRGSFESLDQETLFTIQKFFENNLNVSETSRKLFVHRNTLVYRLEKIKKITGLDLREFDHAIVFKVALMVKKYLNSNPVKY